MELAVGQRSLVYPFSRLQPKPSADDPIVDIHVDREIASEGFTYTLASRREGTIHLEQVLDYNKDPGLLRDRILYALTVEAQRRVQKSALSRRELIRYRLLDQTNYRKSIDQVLALLQALDCDVRLTVRARSA